MSEACVTPMEDHIERAIQLMESGARMTLHSIPDDPSMLSATFFGDVSKALAKEFRRSLPLPTHKQNG